MSAKPTPWPLAAAAGAASVVLGAGIGELAAAFVAPESSPVAVVGDALIDFAPPWAKDAAIALFGTNDKAALLVGIAIVGLALAGFAGWLETRRPPWGSGLLALFGVAGVVAAMTRADAGPLAWLPSVIAGTAAALFLRFVCRLLKAPRADAAANPDRRRFLGWTAGAAVVGVVGIIAADVVRAARGTAAAVRRAITLPSPTASASAPPADLAIDGLASLVTPNDEFYRIDTALVVPQIDPADWSLRIHGLVEEEVVITWDELLALPLEESYTTLTCVSNAVGGNLIGNALWLGYPIRHLLERAKPTADADMVLSLSIDGFTASSPLEALTDDRNAILAVGMNGEPLPSEHGFPVRMVVPGLYGYVSATKWVTELKVTTFAAETAYWTTRGWSDHGPIKLASRIDVPRVGQPLSVGDTVIAGIAWQQQVGVSGVEVQIDDGQWQDAELAPAISDDTWVQWSIPWAATTGEHRIRARATSRDGEVQTSDEAPPAPDGSTGWPERYITVG